MEAPIVIKYVDLLYTYKGSGATDREHIFVRSILQKYHWHLFYIEVNI